MPIFSLIFGDNHKVSVLIGKLMMRGFQNTPDFNPGINVKGVIATKTQAARFAVGGCRYIKLRQF